MAWTTWREDSFAPVIAEAIQRVGTEDPKVLRKSLRMAYVESIPTAFDPVWCPPGCKHPYQAWRSEVRRQLKARKAEAPGQLSLLD